MKPDLALSPAPLLCANEHAALKCDDVRWNNALFSGYLPNGTLVGEQRQCPECDSCVWREIAFKLALGKVLIYLLQQNDPEPVYLRSAWILKSVPAPDIDPDFVGGANPCEPPKDFDWPAFGRALQDRRTGMGLTRSRFSQLWRFSAMDIERIERGRRVPTVRMLLRLLQVCEDQQVTRDASPAS